MCAMLFRKSTPMRLPTRSRARVIRLPGAAMSTVVGIFGSYSAPPATALTGALRDLSCASAATGTPANWASPDSTAGTESVPSATTISSTSSPCFAKKPRCFANIACPVASTAIIATLTFRSC